MADITKNDLRDAMVEAMRMAQRDGGGSFGGPPGGGTGGSGQMGKTLDSLTNEITGLGKAAVGVAADGFGRMMSGSVKVSDAFNITSQNLKGSGTVLGNVFGSLTGVGGKLIGSIEDSMDTYKVLSRSGASFGNSLVELNMQAAGTRLPLKEFTNLVQNNVKGFAGLSGGVAKGATLFAEASQQMFDDSGLIEKFTSMGYTSEELNSLLSYTIVQQKRLGVSDEEAKKRAIEQATMLATEMDAMAKLTGKSRKEQEDELRKTKENGQMRPALDMEIKKGGDGVRKAFDAMSIAGEAGGADFKKLLEQMFAMGRPSKDMAEKFAMAGGEAQRLMKESAAAAKAGNEKDAKRLALEAAAAFAAQQNTTAMQNQARQGNQAAIELNQSSSKLSDRIRAIEKETGLDSKSAEGRRQILAKIAEETGKQQQASADATTRVANTMNNNLADVSAGMRQGVYKQLAKDSPIDQALNEYHKSIKKSYDEEKKVGEKNKLREKTLEETDKAARKLLGVIGMEGPSNKKIVDAIEQGLKQSKDRGTGMTASSKEMQDLYKFIANDKTKEALMKTLEKEGKAQNLDPTKHLENIIAQGPKATKQLLDTVISQDNQRYEEKERRRRQSPGEQQLEDVQRNRKRKDEPAPEESSDPMSSFTRAALGQTGLNVRVLNFPNILRNFEGSPGRGKLLEDFGAGTLSVLHGKETVLNEKQLLNLVNGVSSSVGASNNQESPLKSVMSQMKTIELPQIPKLQPTPKTETTSSTQIAEQPVSKPDTETLKDIHSSLENLNSLMMEMVSNTSNMVSNTQKQIKATKGLNGNIYAR